MKSFLENLNGRLIFIHFVAFLLVMYGAQMLGFLHDYDFLFKNRLLRMNYPYRFDADTAFVEQMGNFGLILSLILSWIACSKKGWHWGNAVIVFVFTFAIENFIFLPNLKIHNVYLSPAGLFHVFSFGGHLALGIGLIAVGVFLIFGKPVMKFIGPKPILSKKAARKPKRVAGAR